MKIRLESLTLENYKKFGAPVAFQFHDQTKISGKNKEGKSTLENTYMEILTGKEVDGTQPDGIRPHGEDGKDLNRADVVREVTLDIDGKETTIRKITKQKWRKPHGQTEEVLDGNTTSFEINGKIYGVRAFEDFMKKIVDPVLFLLCTNANYLISIIKKSTSDGREIIEKAAGFSQEKFIEENPKYSKILEITNGHSVEDSVKILRKQLSGSKKKLEQKNTELKYEQTRDSGSQIEVSDLELAIGEWKEKIAEVDRQEQALDEAVKAYDAANSEILSLKSKLNELANSAGAGLREQRSELNQKISELNIQNRGYANDMKLAEMDLKHAHMGFERHKAELEKARADYSAASKKTFDETKLHEIEAEQFDEDSLICPECGQVRPESQRINLRETFEQSKSRRIKEQEKAREAFNAELSKMLDSITEIGNKASSDLKVAQEAKKEAKQKIAEVRKQILDTSAEIERLCGELDKLPKEVDLSGNAEYQELSEQIKKKEFALSAMDNGSEKRLELRQERYIYLNEISKLDAQIQKFIADEEQKERKLAKLKAEFDNQKQAVADIERNIDVLNQFSIEKNAALAEKINPYFHHFQFSFLERTIEGNPVETCKMVCSGTDYSNLNGGDKKLCEVDLCRGLQEMNGLNLPIWIDEANTIDSWRIPMDMEQQLILISREDDVLKVEEM
ncbi:MAG: hypothetical protein ACLRPH_00740 [Ruminococcus sp.]